MEHQDFNSMEQEKPGKRDPYVFLLRVRTVFAGMNYYRINHKDYTFYLVFLFIVGLSEG